MTDKTISIEPLCRLKGCITRSMLATFLFSTLIVSIGCGPRLPATAPVRGRVTVGSQPLTDGMIVFFPTAGRSAMGTIGADGTFQLTTFESNDGAILGLHRVTIDATKTIVAAAGPKSYEEELKMGGISSSPEKVVWLVSPEYAEPQTTTLTAEVKSGENEINFDLPAFVPHQE